MERSQAEVAAGDRGDISDVVKRRRRPYELMKGAERIHVLYERVVHLSSLGKIAAEMESSRQTILDIVKAYESHG